MSSFFRTGSGLSGKPRFTRVPAIYVEGKSDVSLYSPLLRRESCRLEKIDGSTHSAKLIEKLVSDDAPYVIILDGDYGILASAPKPHKRVIYLSRHSIENYLWEAVPINLCCHQLAQSGEKDDIISEKLAATSKSIRQNLHDLIVLDVAAQRVGLGIAVLPKSINNLLEKKNRTKFNVELIAQQIERIRPQIPEEVLECAKSDIDGFLKSSPITYLLRGHLLFGLMRYILSETASKVAKKKVIIPDQALSQLVADIVWDLLPNQHHAELKHELIGHLREISKQF